MEQWRGGLVSVGVVWPWIVRKSGSARWWRPLVIFTDVSLAQHTDLIAMTTIGTIANDPSHRTVGQVLTMISQPRQSLSRSHRLRIIHGHNTRRSCRALDTRRRRVRIQRPDTWQMRHGALQCRASYLSPRMMVLMAEGKI